MNWMWGKATVVAIAGTLAALVATPALAQQGQDGRGVSVTGVVERFGGAYGEVPYGLRDEATGTVYYLEGDGFDFGAYKGERVTAHGTYGQVGKSAVVNVASIAPVDDPGEELTARFELRVEGEYPEEVAFSGVLGLASGPLTDPDGDGIYTGSVTLPKTLPDDGRQGGVSDGVTVAIVGGTESDTYGRPLEPLPGEEDLVIVDFGTEGIRDGETFSASYSFGEAPASGQIGKAVGVRIEGTAGPDVLSGKAGDDLLVGSGGGDRVKGGAGNDALYAAFEVPAEVAGAAPDLVLGGAGNDFIDTADAPGAPDEVRCGGGDDLVEADVEDSVAGDCEEVARY